jgi:hypothetical protein
MVLFMSQSSIILLQNDALEKKLLPNDLKPQIYNSKSYLSYT